MKGLMTFVALTGIVAAAYAGDLNPPGGDICGAGSSQTDPSTIEGEAAFAKIYDDLYVKIGDGGISQICTDDGTW